ncbi:PAS domain S-box protein [Allocoleopsis franciscana]|uniref:histidine kinase n=1 Tax=Allocoleopsis franciscana PCC 7113 TaxID=1173027 RepID=K9WL70_9CYAN|nr:PAS domain S-box protein [Allocoleopsis franciscana]AFZ20277.1 PAS domain S-box [Allocoleopsis franciscana PCC 7113]
MQYLDKSDTRLKLALQATKSGMWEWNLLTGQVTWSENFEALWGLAPGTLKGTYKSLLKQICVQDRRFVRRVLTRAIRKKTNYRIEFSINCPDGSRRWLRSEGEVYSDGHPIKVSGLCQDITSDKQAEGVERQPQADQPENQEIETSLNTCEQRLNHILNSLEDVAWSATLDRFELIYLNPAAESIYGRPSHEFFQNISLWLEIIHPEDRPHVWTQRQKVLELGGGDMEYRIVRPSGEIRWLRDRLQVIYDRAGQPTRLDGVATDITRQERVIAALQQTNEALEVRLKERTAALEPILEQLHSLSANSPHLSSGSMPHNPENGEMEYVTVARNLALTKQAEAVIERSKAKWRSLIQYSCDLITVVSASGTILYNSPALERILGYSPEELVGQHGLRYIAPEDVAALKVAWKQLRIAAHGSTLSPTTFRALRKDGSWCRLEVTATNLLADEAVEGIAVSARDVTERFRLQELRQPSEAHFRAIFENAALGIALSDPSGEIIASNQALHQMFGYSEQELRQVTITHPDDTAADFTLYQELLAGSIPSYQMEKRYFHKQGYLVWGRLSVSLVRDPSGSLLFVVSMVEDITAAKRTEAALLHISKAVENASDAIAIADTLLVRFNYLNPAFYQMFGYTLEQLNEAGGFTMLFPDAKIMPDVLASAVSGQSWQGEVEMVSRNHSRRQIALRIDAIKDVTGEVVGTIAIHTDITERKQAEAALRRSYERAELLKQITSEIRSSLDPQHIFQTTVTQLGEALLVNRCMIFLYQSAPQSTLSLVAEYLETGYSSIGAFEVPVEGNAHIQQVLATDRAIASTNVYAEPLFADTLPLCRAMDIQSMLAIRTSYQGQPNGVLGLHQCDAYRYWTSSDIELLEAVAAQVGIALAHARLLEKEQCTAAQLAQQNLDLQISNSRANTKAAELEQALQNLQETQAQLVQTEKMSSLGQLLAGVAHEINNPVSFITVNINYACDYIQDLLRIVHLYQDYYPQPFEEIKYELQEIDLDFIIKDLPKLLNSMKVGAERINQIVLSLRNFSRQDEDEMSSVDIHEGIDHTLMILRHRLKAKGGSPEIEVSKNYGKLPQVVCYAGQLNQVFMNLISNAIDAIVSRFAHDHDALVIHTGGEGEIERISPPNYETTPKIKICTETRDNHWVIIRIKDNGPGMTEEVKQKLFNPFFTTKPAGKGTGLGLSISYQIVVEKHGGHLQCISVPGQGTEFMIELPIHHS